MTLFNEFIALPILVMMLCINGQEITQNQERVVEQPSQQQTTKIIKQIPQVASVDAYLALVKNGVHRQSYDYALLNFDPSSSRNSVQECLVGNLRQLRDGFHHEDCFFMDHSQWIQATFRFQNHVIHRLRLRTSLVAHVAPVTMFRVDAPSYQRHLLVIGFFPTTSHINVGDAFAGTDGTRWAFDILEHGTASSMLAQPCRWLRRDSTTNPIATILVQPPTIQSKRSICQFFENLVDIGGNDCVECPSQKHQFYRNTAWLQGVFQTALFYIKQNQIRVSQEHMQILSAVIDLIQQYGRLTDVNGVIIDLFECFDVLAQAKELQLEIHAD
jgi:hypothetical protein